MSKKDRGRPATGAGKLESEPKDEPFRIKLPRFIVDEDVGLGDVIKRITYRAGAKPCSGCERRAAALNRRVVFTPRGSYQKRTHYL